MGKGAVNGVFVETTVRNCIDTSVHPHAKVDEMLDMRDCLSFALAGGDSSTRRGGYIPCTPHSRVTN